LLRLFDGHIISLHQIGIIIFKANIRDYLELYLVNGFYKEQLNHFLRIMRGFNKLNSEFKTGVMELVKGGHYEDHCCPASRLLLRCKTRR
jgi:hypothetical protein